MLRKIFLITSFAILSLSATAQEFSFGLNAGYLNLNATVENEVDGIDESLSESGFYVGVLGEIAFNQNFALTTAVNYGNVEDTNFLMVPVLAKFYISNSDFYLQAGPQLTFLLEDTFGFLNETGIDISGGIGYDITDNFFVSGRYSHELTNRIPSEYREGVYSDINGKYHGLNIGLGYKF